MKCFATFGVVGGEWELVAGPNADYESQSSLVKEATVSGSDYEELRLVDLTKGTAKRRKPAAAAPKTAKKKTSSKDSE